MKNPLFIFFITTLILPGCSHSTDPNKNPDWINALIAKYQNQPPGNPPQSIWRYEYNGETVYYVPAQCCDQFSTLYNGHGDIICAPDGGFAGGGDGRCPDFFARRTNEKLIWKDGR